MYKDKDRQKQAQRKWVRQKRAEAKGSTRQGSTAKGVTFYPVVAEGSTQAENVIPKYESHADVSDISIVKDLHAAIHKRAKKGSTAVGTSDLKNRDVINGEVVVTSEILSLGQEGVTGLCNEGEQLDPREFVPIKDIPNYGQTDCPCQHCQGVKVNSSKHLLNHGQPKSGIMFKPECVTCPDMVEGDNGAAACEVDGVCPQAEQGSPGGHN